MLHGDCEPCEHAFGYTSIIRCSKYLSDRLKQGLEVYSRLFEGYEAMPGYMVAWGSLSLLNFQLCAGRRGFSVSPVSRPPILLERLQSLIVSNVVPKKTPVMQ